MNKTRAQLQPTTLELDELDQVTGGTGVFDPAGQQTGLYSAQAAKGIGSWLALGAVPAAGMTHGTTDVATTLHGHLQPPGQTTWGAAGAPAADVALSSVPGGVFFHEVGPVS